MPRSMKESNVTSDNPATVELHHGKTGARLMTLHSDMTQNVGQVKRMLASKLNADLSHVTCVFKDGLKPDTTTLGELSRSSPKRRNNNNNKDNNNNNNKDIIDDVDDDVIQFELHVRKRSADARRRNGNLKSTKDDVGDSGEEEEEEEEEEDEDGDDDDDGRNPEYKMPDTIIVKVPEDDDNNNNNNDGSQTKWKEIKVKIVRHNQHQPQNPTSSSSSSATASLSKLGGYRNTRSGLLYKNACMQTTPKPWSSQQIEAYKNRRCRDTQTFLQSTTSQQTPQDTSTQMSAAGLVYVSRSFDKVVVPGQYVEADLAWQIYIRKVITAQRYARRWLARKQVTKMRMKKKRMQEWRESDRERVRKEIEERLKWDVQRRANPTTKEDFQLLYSSLKEWKEAEERKLRNELSGAELRAALCMLLDEEARMIGHIEEMKVSAFGRIKNEKIIKQLQKMSAPKSWRRPGDNRLITMETPQTKRAGELKELHRTINMPMSVDERLDALLILKNTVQIYNCQLTRDLIELIERETDLLVRGVRKERLEGLRKRIVTLFVEFIKNPGFNPEAGRLITKQKSSLHHQQQNNKENVALKVCANCCVAYTSGGVSTTQDPGSKAVCAKCRKQLKEKCSFKRFLDSVIEEEIKRELKPSVVFMLQESDMEYLVLKIWDGQSILSGVEGLDELTMVRWHSNEEWSPWNCLLVTKNEALVHANVTNLRKAYGNDLIQKIHNKHTLARSFFSKIPHLSSLMSA